MREETSLDLFGDFDFLGGTALGFEPLGKGAALRFDGVGDLVEAHQRKRIAVGILEASKDAAPNRSVLRGGRRCVRQMRSAHVDFILETLQARRELETDAALAPFAVLGNYILGDESDVRGLADELALFRAGFWRDEREVRGAVGGATVTKRLPG